MINASSVLSGAKVSLVLTGLEKPSGGLPVILKMNLKLKQFLSLTRNLVNSEVGYSPHTVKNAKSFKAR